jgi:hypothetical protein
VTKASSNKRMKLAGRLFKGTVGLCMGWQERLQPRHER